MTDIPLNQETWAIVPVFNNKPPSDAVCWGSLPEVLEYIGQTQARAAVEERIASAQEQLKNDAKTLQRAQKLTADAIPRFTALGDALVTAHEQKAKRDAEAKRVAAEQAEAKRVQDLLDSLPDPDNPNAQGDDGELEIKHAPNKEHLQPQDGITGSFPTRLEKQAPRGGEYQETDIKKLAYPQTPPQQPVAISLNTE